MIQRQVSEMAPVTGLCRLSSVLAIPVWSSSGWIMVQRGLEPSCGCCCWCWRCCCYCSVVRLSSIHQTPVDVAVAQENLVPS